MPCFSIVSQMRIPHIARIRGGNPLAVIVAGFRAEIHPRWSSTPWTSCPFARPASDALPWLPLPAHPWCEALRSLLPYEPQFLRPLARAYPFPPEPPHKRPIAIPTSTSASTYHFQKPDLPSKASARARTPVPGPPPMAPRPMDGGDELRRRATVIACRTLFVLDCSVLPR